MKLPAGITTISGQSGQSRNTVPGALAEVATAGGLASAALFVPCPKAIMAKVIPADRMKFRNCFIIVTLPSLFSGDTLLVRRLALASQCDPRSFLTTWPPFITNRTRSSSPMSASGSPATATRSANLPGSTSTHPCCSRNVAGLGQSSLAVTFGRGAQLRVVLSGHTLHGWR